ncbi:Uncharacterised protein (plasmid) [Legionella adelaidensis]|uniref:Uncharacterized protein n=1 Tax=Legionella adelaidensis TaxID=45056 RepID=A0A0W0R5C9_9GAMM|nr:hypothetical protein [Legionella adelaidensis]KTC66292.1 hypothetical protein Lade_0950 [Legionella adelaidensis]VEH84888.1 Uncharacterised protein [Legionella adelaidensis]
MPQSDLFHFQAAVMNLAIARAREIAIDPQTQLNFDPQGRVLIEIKKSDLDDAIVAQAGRPLSDKITVSLDIHDFPTLLGKYYEAIEEKLITHKVKHPEAIVQQLQHSQSIGSINAIQQELHFHLSLSLRTWQTFFDEIYPGKFAGKEAELEKAYKDTLEHINELVLNEFAKALIKAQKPGEGLDISILNNALDKARESLARSAHDYLFKNILTNTHVIFSKDDLIKLHQNKSRLKEIAEQTTATPNDVIHTSCHQGLATWISGSENTAHHRVKGFDHLPQRQIISHPYKGTTVSTHEAARIQIRTPSLDVKDDEVKRDPKPYIADIADKLDGIKKFYSLDYDELLDDPKAFIYNLHTASNDYIFGLINAGDRNGNEQTQGADLILKGSHLYNKKQLDEERDAGQTPVFCFVQNLSVSGFGDTLGYTGNPLKQEATLMAEMALIHTLYPFCTPEQQAEINAAKDNYKKFLNKDERGEYFSASIEGQKALEIIRSVKDSWKAEPELPSEDFFQNAANSLKILIANDLHFSHDYAKLIQTLSIFVEKASIAGCKSGNERAQAINGRVAILDKLFHTPSEDRGIIADLLKQLAMNPNQPQEIATLLKNSIDNEYNLSGLQQAASLISLLDQGAASKVKAKSPYFYTIDRNHAEEPTMTHLHQNKSDLMQAHKGLGKFMFTAAEENIEDHLRNLGVIQLRIKKRERGELPDSIGEYNGETIVHIPEKEKHRLAFLQYLYSVHALGKPKMNPRLRDDLIRRGKQGDAAISMEQLLGPEGVELYTKALQEERDSVEFKKAIWEKATEETINGDRQFKKRFVAQILGPAGVGKTGAVRAMLRKLEEFMERDPDVPGQPMVAKVDGGDTREVSQIRRWALQHAIDMNYTGIRDLYDIGDKPILDEVKAIDVEDVAVQDPHMNIVIPTTDLKKVNREKLEHPESLQEVIVQVIGRREVIEYQQISRAWKTDWRDEQSLAESKAPPWLPLASYIKGTYYAEKGLQSAKDKDTLVFCVINDSILVKESEPGNNNWLPTDKISKGVIQVSERVYMDWLRSHKQEDLKSFNKRMPPLITTPELLMVETTVKDLEKIATDLKREGLLEIIHDVKNLQPVWESHKWQEYQEKIDKIRNNIDYLQQEYPPLPGDIKEDLSALDEQLKMARNKVPTGKKIPIPEKVEKKREQDAFYKVAEQEVSELGFTHRIINKGESITPDSKTKPQVKNQISSSTSLITKYQEITLKKDQVIQASITFEDNNKGVLLQNHRGTVTDASPQKLTSSQQVKLAVEQAKMFLSNWRPGSGDIIIRGTDLEMANKVYAAILLLKDSHPSLKDLSIKSFVTGCDGPGRFDSITRFINRHLGSPSNGPIKTETREFLKTELSALFNNPESNAYKLRLASINLADKPGEDTPPLTPHSSD